MEISNLRFEHANLYELPFPDDYFDAVYSNAVLEHLKEPMKALQEMRRVLKSGGVIGVSDVDWSSGLFAPEHPALETSKLYLTDWEANGGNPYIGKELRGLLRKIGFARIESSAWCYSFGPGSGIIVDRFDEPEFEDRFIERGWVNRESYDDLKQSLREWGQNPDHFIGVMFCSALGWKH